MLNSDAGPQKSKILRLSSYDDAIRAEFHSVGFADWTGNPLFTYENFSLNLNRMLRVTKNLLCQFQSTKKLLLSGNQPLH